MNDELNENIFEILKFHKIDERVNVKIILDSNKRAYSLINIENGHNLTHHSSPNKINHCLYLCDKNGELYHVNKETFEAFSKRLSPTEKEGLKIQIKSYLNKKLRELNEIAGKEYTLDNYELMLTDLSVIKTNGYSMCDESIVL